MDITISKQLRKRLIQRARRHGMTEQKFVQEALRYIVSGEETAEQEMREWRKLSFWEKHDL